jgi:endonuclease YncB( thermonuclease family)
MRVFRRTSHIREARRAVSPSVGPMYLVLIAICFAFVAPALAGSIRATDIRVIDGDTIRVFHKRPNVRLVGFNAPETRHAACEAERALGAKATRRLRELVRSRSLMFRFVRCACRPGTERTRACNYGRRCGILEADGHDVGAILIAERLAVPFICGANSCPQTPRPWCR